jgi:hypothetical protein
MLEVLILNALLILMAIVSLAMAAWALLSGHAAKDSFDGTFLFLGSLLLAIVFSINPILAWRQGLLPEALKKLSLLERLSLPSWSFARFTNGSSSGAYEANAGHSSV